MFTFGPQTFVQVVPLFFVKIASFKMQRKDLLLQMCLVDQPACKPITDEYRV